MSSVLLATYPLPDGARQGGHVCPSLFTEKLLLSFPPLFLTSPSGFLWQRSQSSLSRISDISYTGGSPGRQPILLKSESRFLTPGWQVRCSCGHWSQCWADMLWLGGLSFRLESCLQESLSSVGLRPTLFTTALGPLFIISKKRKEQDFFFF